MANSRQNNGAPINSQLRLHHIKKTGKYKNKFMGKNPRKLNKSKNLKSNKRILINQKNHKYDHFSPNSDNKEVLVVPNDSSLLQDPVSKSKNDDVIIKGHKEVQSHKIFIPMVIAHFEPHHNNYQAHNSNIYVSRPYQQFINTDYIFRDMDANEIRYQNSKNIPDPEWMIVKDFVNDGQKAIIKESKKAKKHNLLAEGITNKTGEICYIEENISDEAYTRYHEKYETIEREYKKRDREWRKLMEESGTTSTSIKRKIPKENIRLRQSNAESKIQETNTSITKSPIDQDLKRDKNMTTKYPRPSYWPSIYDIECLEIINDIDKQVKPYPLTAFGRQVPQVNEAHFKLPWK